jgi:hypothetical protein
MIAPPFPAWIFVRFASPPRALVSTCLDLARFLPQSYGGGRPRRPALPRAAVSSSFLTVAAPCSGARCSRRDKGEWGYRFLRKLGPILRRTEPIVPRSKDAL